MKKILLSIAVISSLAVIIAFTTSEGYTVVNKTDLEVVSISIAPSGENFRSSESFSTHISKGESSGINFTAESENCSYDVKFIDSKGQEFIVTDVELCNNNVITLATNKADIIQPVQIQPAH